MLTPFLTNIPYHKKLYFQKFIFIRALKELRNAGERSWFNVSPGVEVQTSGSPTTASIREIPSEVFLSNDDGMPKDCAMNCDHLQTVSNHEEPIEHEDI